MALLNRLKEYRARLGINQTELGKLAGVSRQTISLIERGDYSPSVTLALKLAKICQVKVEDIFEYEENAIGSPVLSVFSAILSPPDISSLLTITRK